ncbi:hypothetical protein [Georgenia faecalis]|nr:hypothetical protein [Georgenia faecalis]
MAGRTRGSAVGLGPGRRSTLSDDERPWPTTTSDPEQPEHPERR